MSIPRYLGSLLASVLFGLTMALIMVTPLSLLSTVLAVPLYGVFPSLSQSGPDVTWWFLGVQPRSAFAWIAFITYFSLLAFSLYWLFVLVSSALRR